MSECLNISEIEAYLHPHSHKYDLQSIAVIVNKLLFTGTEVSMVDIDAIASKNKLAKKNWGEPLGPERFKLPVVDYSRYHALGYVRPGAFSIPVAYDDHGLPVTTQSTL